MRLWLGLLTFLAGAVLWFLTGASFGPRRTTLDQQTDAPRRAPFARAVWAPRLGLALGALGIAVLATTRAGLGWSISSICFALIAIVLLIWVLRDNLR